MKTVVVFDSFKGSVSSSDAAVAAQKGIRRALPEAEILTFAMADGGEGTLEAIERCGGFIRVGTSTFDALMRTRTSDYLITRDGTMAVVELAAASGLTLLDEWERNPLETTTFGTGLQIRDAIARGCREICLFIGGSATNDAGTGILSALGFRFLDCNGEELAPKGKNLGLICSIDSSKAMPQISECRFTVACDVDNPFFGPTGAAHIYSRQKGADTQGVLMLDEGMRNFAEIIYRSSGREISSVGGAGAAGGVAGGLLALLGARLCSGMKMIAQMTGADQAIREADIVVTGEGSVDCQSFMGKVVGGICSMPRRPSCKVIVLCGRVGLSPQERQIALQAGADAIFPIQNGPISIVQAMDADTAAENIERTAYEIFRICI